MRNLFLFLLLINLLAFAYQSWILEPAVSVEPDFIAQDVPQLLPADRNVASSSSVQTAADVTKPLAETAAATLAVEPDRVIAGTRATASLADKCIRVGPFAREADADTVQRELQRRQATVRRTTEAGRIWLGYWVQSAPYSSRQAAEIARKTLINKDMPDAYVIADNNEYRVSLGVFRLRTSADEAVARASGRGFATRVVERFQPGTNYWLIARLPGDGELPTSALPSAPGQILRSESITCAE